MAATLLQMILLMPMLIMLSKTVASAPNALPGCPDNCGGKPIPYPFGIRKDCSMKGFELSCNTTSNGTSTPYLGTLEIVNVDLLFGQARISSPISYQCYDGNTKVDEYLTWHVWTTHFRFSHEKNKFMVIGCDTLAYISFQDAQNNSYLGGCVLQCSSRSSIESLDDGSCSGIGCCKTAIPKGTNNITVQFDRNYNNSRVYSFNRCGYAVVMEDTGFVFDSSYVTTEKLYRQNRTAVLDWAIGNTTCEIASSDVSSYACKSTHSQCLNSISGPGYLCNCSDGYQGNPYLPDGCQDIDECLKQNPCSRPAKCHNLQGGYRCSCPFGWRSKDKRTCEINLATIIGSCAGIIALMFFGFAIYVFVERRNLSKVKKMYFQQHGGWILLEKIKSTQGFGFTIFTKQELEQATNSFNGANIIGQGGQGTVFKGTLNGQNVAIKKCKIIDENKKKEFGKEMLILSQINHKNIVKLLGCCLEVDVPMLVYEFIPNGTLSHYIHYKMPGSHVSLTTRLRIAHESAEALAYLHTSASPPIFHGDVKSANILLDQNYSAKVSDFGASILAPTDEAQIVTFVQGTCGYLDPEYMQSCQLTDKSDVYSFGVVLLELLTSKPVIDFNAPEEERGLSSRFLLAMKENKMQELLDDEIKSDEDMELMREVAELAKSCLSLKGDERPTMKEVADELGQIIHLKQHPWRQIYHPEETEHFLSGRESSHHIEIEYTGSFSLQKKTEKNIVAR